MASSTTDMQGFIMSAMIHHGLIIQGPDQQYQLPSGKLETEVVAISDRLKLIEDQKIADTIVTIENAFRQADQYVTETKAEVQNLTIQMQSSLQEMQKHQEESTTLNNRTSSQRWKQYEKQS